MEKIPYLGLTLTRWRVGKSTFLALPEMGARLMNWNVTLGDDSVRDVIYWPELKAREDLFQARGGNPILFPFSARTFDRGDIHFWRDPSGNRRPMPMHGFARWGEFKVTRMDAAGFTAEFIPPAEARKAYPYDYQFTVTYRFESLGLNCEFSLENRGREPLPWCPGHHFYFTVPWSEGKTRDDYLIRIPADRRFRQDAKGQLVAGPELREMENLANPDLVETIHTELRSNDVGFGEKDGPGDVVIRFGTQKEPPPDATIVTWTAAGDSPFYCVEPWMGPPNSPENKRGLHFVPPGGTETFTVSVHLK